MKKLAIALLCAGIVKSGSAITTFNSAPIGKATDIEVEWGKSTLTIKYVKNGQDQVFKANHKIPSVDGMVIDAGVKGATDPDAFITAENMSYQLLDDLVWEECNKYRATKNLPPVAQNKLIGQAAAHHSYYQQFYSSLQHGEDLEIPHRANFQNNYNKVYGSAAEICLYNWTRLGRSTYRELAKACIDQWADSPGHNAIMISKSYSYNGFGTCLQYSDKGVVNREVLEAYDPALLARIEREVPEAIDATPFDKLIQVWASGNFTRSEPQPTVAMTRLNSTRTLSSAAPSDNGNEFRGTGSNSTNTADVETETETEIDFGAPSVGTRAAARNSRALALEKEREERKEARSSKSGYTVLPRHPNAKSGMARLKPNKYKNQAGNGGKGKSKGRKRKGYKKGQHRGCDAYM